MSLNIIYDDGTGTWDIRQEPFVTIDIETEDDYNRMLDENEFWKCPSCANNCKDVKLRDGQKYCHYCGQALDWNE